MMEERLIQAESTIKKLRLQNSEELILLKSQIENLNEKLQKFDLDKIKN